MRRWVVLAGGAIEAAERAASERGAVAVKIVDAPTLLREWRSFRADIAKLKPDAVVAHSADWSRQSAPQLFELALAAAPTPARLLIDDGRVDRSIGRRSLVGRVVRDGALAVPLALGAAVGVLPSKTAASRNGASASTRRVLALWRGSGESVGGAATHVAGILGGFGKCGYGVDAVVGGGVVPAQLEEVADHVEAPLTLPARYRMLPDMASIFFNGQAVKGAAALLARTGAAFVYQRNAAFLDAGVDIATGAGVPLVLEWNGSAVWSRDIWENVTPFERVFDHRLRTMQRRVLDAATIIVAVSDAAAALAVAEGAAESKVSVVPNGVDLDAIRAVEHGEHPGPLRLGWIGSFGPWHGADVLVEALASVRTPVRLVLVGDGVTRPTCERLAAEMGVADRIEWLGRLPHYSAIEALRSCDVLVSPHVPLAGQEFFGSPTKIFEYMAIGLPIVASRLGQIGEILRDSETAILVSPGDVQDLARGIDAVAGMPDRGRALGVAARRDAEAHHGWQRRAEQVLVAALGSARQR